LKQQNKQAFGGNPFGSLADFSEQNLQDRMKTFAPTEACLATLS